MATKTFLTPDDFTDAQQLLLPPMVPPSSDFWEGQSFPSQEFSSWLSLHIEGRLRGLPAWKEAHPIAIGSWGRGELCPLSDLDVIFCGTEDAVKNVIREADKQGIEFKYRFPKNPNDWSADSPLFESNALFWSRPFTKEAAQALQQQKTKVYDQRNKFRQKLIKELAVERKRRNIRHDSIANYLEPQLKFGPGGLRDIEQALMIRFWFPEKMNSQARIFADLAQLKAFLMTVRQKLNLLGFQDTLVASHQKEISLWFGFKTQADFMRELQNVLARGSFYCDLIFDMASSSEKALANVPEVKSVAQALSVLQKDPSLLFQARVLQFQDGGEFAYAHALKSFFNVQLKENSLLALFRSQLLMKILPEFLVVKGVVQHDQYHRFTVDAHIFQAVRRVLRVHNTPKLIGKLAQYSKAWTTSDWDILLWSALYHDLGKARQKDHSIESKELVEKDFARLGQTKSFTEEVAWMVENHLVLSTAAFRKDPHSPQVWQDLYDRGVHGERLRRLAIFTAIDIYATNPDAWTGWKERLIFQLVQSMEAPQGAQFFEMQKVFQKKNIDAALLQRLDPGILMSLKPQDLVKDLTTVLAKKNVPPVVCISRAKQGSWIRFHHPQDEAGLFLQYVTRLWQSGVTIHHAYIHTDPDLGVYDWFEVKSDKPLSLLRRTLVQEVAIKEPKNWAKLSDVALVSETKNEWVFSFRGTDKKGVLISAARALHDLGLEIRWAKIHTWGRQVDDVFGISPNQGRAVAEWLQELKKRLT